MRSSSYSTTTTATATIIYRFLEYLRGDERLIGKMRISSLRHPRPASDTKLDASYQTHSPRKGTSYPVSVSLIT